MIEPRRTERGLDQTAMFTDNPVEFGQTSIMRAEQFDDLPAVRLQPARGWLPLNLGELWDGRELIYFLIWRDVKVRYKQTALGVAWAVIQPLATMIVFSLFFGRLARMPSDGVPYSAFNLAGLVPWSLFANGLSHVSNSLVESSNLLRKVYFPRLAIPIGALLSSMVDFVFTVFVLIGLLLWYGLYQTITALMFPVFILLALVTCLGAGLWLAALNVQYRDVRYVVPFLIQLLLFATPIAYPSSLLPESWRILYALNPMVGVIEGSRWALLRTNTAPGIMIAVSSAVAVGMLLSGLFYFRKMERTFADVV